MLSVIKTFSDILEKYKGAFSLAVMCMIFMDIIAYLLPLAVKYVTDDVFPCVREPGMLNHLYVVSALVLLASILRGIFAHIMIRSYWYVGESVVRDLRNRLYEKLHHLDAAFYARSRTGDLMSRVSTDIQRIRNFFAFGIEHRLRIILISLSVLVLMLLQNWRLAVVVYAMIPAVYLIVIRFSKKLQTAVLRKHRQAGRLSAALQENLTGIRIVKAFAMENPEMKKFDTENSALKEADIYVTTLQAHLNPILQLTAGIGSLLILVYGGYQVITGDMSLGVLLGFVTYLMIMRFPLMILAFNTSLINLARGAAVRINEILTITDQRENDRGEVKKHIQGRLEFDDVCFQYEPEQPILENLSFDIQPGERVAIFGLTGSGKSSLISLIPRFYKPCDGQIRLDGICLENWDLEYLRSNIGTVLQETFLFSMSIRDNIAFGRPSASIDEIESAAKTAQIHEFIKKLPDGYETMVGEYGAGLSGGQRQRIAIARALLQDPRILILDDCTSSLDSLTERQIQRELQSLMKGRTTVIIAQRITTLRLADRIIVLDQGTVQDFDSHEKLLEKNDLYRTAYETQMVCSESINEDSMSAG
ncbi:MAG: ABC transporter ATP-binding protein [candidate division KSB1 bacterium]|nr:ABC transporter ATP-binding protein [candidate division KSB1 bacterium]